MPALSAKVDTFKNKIKTIARVPAAMRTQLNLRSGDAGGQTRPNKTTRQKHQVHACDAHLVILDNLIISIFLSVLCSEYDFPNNEHGHAQAASLQETR